MDYQKQIDEIKSTAKFGDLIEFCYPIGYSHWAVYEKDGHVIHFAVADENKLMSSVRTYLQSAFPMSGDILLGQTKIRRMPIEEVNVPTGACISIDNNSHKFPPSSKKDMRKRLNLLLNLVFTYDLFSCNCEHFVTFVRYGRAVCNQIPGRPQDTECEKTTKLFQGQDPIASKCCLQ